MTRRVAYVTTDLLGYVHRFLPIGRELVARGIGVTVISASPRTVGIAQAAGFDAVHLRDEHEALADVPLPERWPTRLRSGLRQVPGLHHGPRRAAIAHWSARAAALHGSGELTDALRQTDPFLVLTEAEQHREIRHASAGGWPVMLFEDFYSTRPGPDVPFPSRSHQVPTGTVASRLRATARWRRFFAMEWVRRRAERWWLAGYDWSSVVEAVPYRVADGSAGQVSRQYVHRYDYTDLPRLRTIAPELAFPGEPQPPTVVGPVVDEDRAAEGVDDDFPRIWAEIMRRVQGAESRLVYASLGTFLSRRTDLVHQIIEAVAVIPHVELIVAVGRDHDSWRRSGAEVPNNVHVFGRVPQIEVLRHAELLVSTGGLNSGHEAVWFGVPTLNLPISGIDTAGNAARTAYHGLGLTLPPGQISVDAIRASATELLANPRWAKQVGDMAQIVRGWEGVTRAADAIEAQIGPATIDPATGR